MSAILEKILPTGRAVRIRSLSTREKLAADRRVEARKGDGVSAIIETLASALIAYTRSPVPIINKEDGTPDPDLTFKNVETAGLWVPATYESLTVDGPDNMLEVFSDMRDFNALSKAFDQAVGLESPLSALMGKARTVSVAR